MAPFGAMENMAMAIMQGTVQGGASRHVAAAVAAAIIRTVGNGASDGYSLVAVPNEVAKDIPVVAASMASQRILGTASGKEFHNAGLAYAEVRAQYPEEAKEIRAVNQAANIAKHGRGRGG
eukprot:16449826-Heterocapsa_arctica.AAC.1